jgi:hypothetical protein
VKNEMPNGRTSRRCVGERWRPSHDAIVATESAAKLKYLKTERTPR